MGLVFVVNINVFSQQNSSVLFYKGSMYSRLLNMLKKKKINIASGILELLKASVLRTALI